MKVCALLRCGMVSTAIEFLWYGYLFKKPWQDGHACTLAEAHALQKIDA